MRVPRILFYGTALTSVGVWVVGCGDAATDPIEPSRPTAVTVAAASVRLVSLDATVQLAAVVHDQYGQVLADARVAWSSADASVASVDAAGLVTAMGDGTAEIAAAVGSASGTVTVTVNVSAATDRDALVALYEATDGPNWGNNTNWLTDAPLDDWHGVNADTSGKVVELKLGDNALSGPIPTALSNLGNLTRLSLPDNSLSGPIPATLGNLTKLTNLDLNDNDLSGAIPPELGKLTKLTNLELDDNGLTGTIPIELGSLVDLEGLYLNSNSLTGPIPTELGSLAKLKRLYLDRNDLTGPIPSELGGLANLERLYLNSNDLSGSIPAELGGLAKLVRLYLGSNDLTGPIPAELGGLAKLTRLRLGSNELSGAIPPELGDLGALEELNLGTNSLSGPIVPELGELASLKSLYADRNSLSGPIPSELGGIATLERLYIYGNSLSGPIPTELGDLANLERLHLGSNELVGPVPTELGGLAKLERLYLDNNDLTGPLPSSFLKLDRLHRFRIAENESLCVPGIVAFATWIEGIEEPDAAPVSCNAADVFELVLLFEVAGGSDWKNSDGWLNGFAVDGWHGVSADSLGRVLALDLADNGLSGWLPSTLGAVSKMTALQIDENPDLTGRLPNSLSDLTLRTLHYDGTALCIPADISFQAWLKRIASHEGTGVECPPLSDTETVQAVYEAAKRCMMTRAMNQGLWNVH